MVGCSNANVRYLMVIFHIIFSKMCLSLQLFSTQCLFEKPKINEKEAEDGPFLKKYHNKSCLNRKQMTCPMANCLKMDCHWIAACSLQPF